MAEFGPDHEIACYLFPQVRYRQSFVISNLLVHLHVPHNNHVSTGYITSSMYGDNLRGQPPTMDEEHCNRPVRHCRDQTFVINDQVRPEWLQTHHGDKEIGSRFSRKASGSFV